MKQTMVALSLCAVLAACSQSATDADRPAPAPSAETAPPSPASAAAPVTTPTAPPAASPLPSGTAEKATPAAPKAQIAQFNATCPGDVAVHADAGGPVFINGKEAKVKFFSDNYFEASDPSAHLTISVTLDPDGSRAVSYTGPGRKNGVCRDG